LQGKVNYIVLSGHRYILSVIYLFNTESVTLLDHTCKLHYFWLQ